MSRFSLARRSPAREIMDEVEPPQAVMDEVCWFLGLINRWLGGTLATLRRFDAFARGWRPGE